MTSVHAASGPGCEGDRIVVHLYCADHDCSQVEELLNAVANSVRWKDRIDLRIEHLSGRVGAPAEIGPVGAHSVVVCGTHVIHDADYHSIARALEDCEAMQSEG